MTIYPDRPPDFQCVVCGDERSAGRWPNRTEYDIPPVCRHCERDYGTGFGGRHDLNRDRRIAGQIMVLARALEGEAYRAASRKGFMHGRA